MRISYLSSAVLLINGISVAASSYASTSDYSNMTVAVVRSPPVNWPMPILNKTWNANDNFDLNATVDYGVALIEEAASNGANLVVFPEVWFPGYPKGMDGYWLAEHVAEYINNSLVVGSPQWELLVDAARTNEIYVMVGFSERTEQSIFMAQALVDPSGNVLIHRQKLRPSGSERALWSDGFLDGLKVVETPYGIWGLLDCWEHFHPTMTFPMQAQLEYLHIGTWPYQTDYGTDGAQYWESNEVNTAAARLYAVKFGAVTIFAAIGFSSVISGEGLDQATISVTTIDEEPMLYHSINATAFANESYDVDGEQSWGVLEEIETAWPYYIPKVTGDYVTHKETNISTLLAYAAGFNYTTGTSNVTLVTDVSYLDEDTRCIN